MRIKMICVFVLLNILSLQALDYCEIVGKHTNKLSQSFEKKYKLTCYGTGGGMMHEINRKCYDYCRKGLVTVNEARDIYIPVLASMIHCVNNLKQIRPYLHHYPVGPETIQISISFTDNGSSDAEKNVAYVRFSGGKVSYFGAKNMSNLIFEESYEEAIGKVDWDAL